jgi:uncharacterized membrane protein
MFLNSSVWARMHGGVTHFPIALVLAALGFDLAGHLLRRTPRSSELHAAGYYALLLGALGSIAAVVSGLILSRGEIQGSGALALHHLFLWPAFALLIGLAVWRLLAGQVASHRAFSLYLAVSVVMAGLMTVAGYWGGEMLLAGG